MVNRPADSDSRLRGTQKRLNRFHEALIGSRRVVSQSDSALNRAWRPAAMVEVDCDREPPRGFTAHLLRGMRLRLNLLEPEESLATPEGWLEAIEELEAWGEVPEEVSAIELDADERGAVLRIEAANGSWTAEILPWSSPNIRPRARIAPESARVPCGGYLHEDADLILLRRADESDSLDAATVLLDHLQRDDLDSAQVLLHRCGAALGRYHAAAEAEWTNPPDQKRWNERFGELETRLKSASLWRAPFTRGAPATLDLGDVRLAQFAESKSGEMGIRIGPSRLAYGLIETKFDLPAIRDFASLLMDLSRIHLASQTTLKLTPLRASLIEGWSSTAPPPWCTQRAFSAHTGGVVIWEYEQALLDVVEAVSHQSGRPEPAVTLVEKVPTLQKSLFNARILSAVSWMLAILGAIGGSNWIKLAFEGEVLFPSYPLLLFLCSWLLRRRYHAAAPPPEIPFHRDE